jgi:hypothetical protein
LDSERIQSADLFGVENFHWSNIKSLSGNLV